MTRTLIALLATAAIALPAAAQQTNSQQGSMQYNSPAGQQATTGKTGSMGKANANAPGTKYGNRNYSRGHMAANASKRHIRGRTSYRQYGRRGYGVRAGGPGYAYLHGRRYGHYGRYAYNLRGRRGVGAYGSIH